MKKAPTPNQIDKAIATLLDAANDLAQHRAPVDGHAAQATILMTACILRFGGAAALDTVKRQTEILTYALAYYKQEPQTPATPEQQTPAKQ